MSHAHNHNSLYGYIIAVYLKYVNTFLKKNYLVQKDKKRGGTIPLYIIVKLSLFRL